MQTFSISSSNAHCTPSRVLALASINNIRYFFANCNPSSRATSLLDYKITTYSVHLPHFLFIYASLPIYYQKTYYINFISDQHFDSIRFGWIRIYFIHPMPKSFKCLTIWYVINWKMFNFAVHYNIVWFIMEVTGRSKEHMKMVLRSLPKSFYPSPTIYCYIISSLNIYHISLLALPYNNLGLKYGIVLVQLYPEKKVVHKICKL